VLTHITNMVNITLSLPEELHKRMMEHTELKWSDVARQAFEKKINELELIDKILKKSKLTERDTEEIGNRIKAEIRKRFKLKFGK